MGVRRVNTAGRLVVCGVWVLGMLVPRWGAAQAGGEGAQGVTVVTGHVSCADTQHAARFAQVELISASAADGEPGFRGRGGFGAARTDLEGNFSIANVSPGDYFLVGQLTGYVNLRNAVETALNAGTDPASAAPGVVRVHVGAGGGSADLLLQRGGVVAGTVAWDDGSPAAGVQVALQAAPTTSATEAATPQQGGPYGGFGQGFAGAVQTDDRGRFRVSGLASGSYVVRASVQAPMPQQAGSRYGRTLNVAVYAPDKPRKTEATVIKLAQGEERDDVAVTMGLSSLHNVSGAVSSPGAAVRSGTVTLTDQTDSSLSRTGVINADGSFVVAYVPAGSYTLRTNASSQVQSGYGRGGGGQTAGGGSFQPLQESVTITDSDLTGVNLSVNPATSTAAQ